MLRLSFLLVTSCQTYQSIVDRGFWLLNHFSEEAECSSEYGSSVGIEYDLWSDAYRVLNQTETSISQLVVTLKKITTPFGISDPAIALQCPLGASALLEKLGIALVEIGEHERALRILHLAKLFYFHRYPDLGDYIETTRWSNSINRIMHNVRIARQAPRPKFEITRNFSQQIKVQMVSYCYYPSGQTKLPEWSFNNKIAYAGFKGLNMKHFNKPLAEDAHAWMNKLLVLEEGFESAADWVMWVDCDAFFMNWDMEPTHILASVPDHAHVVISEDANMLNTAVFFLRVNDWSRAFLRTVKSLLNAPSPFSFRDNAYHEQSPIMYWLLFPSVLESLTDSRTSDLTSDLAAGASQIKLNAGYRDEVFLVPQNVMNAYPKEIAQRSAYMHHDTYETGDWIISFNGCGSLLGGEFCENLWQHHYDESMKALTRTSSSH